MQYPTINSNAQNSINNKKEPVNFIYFDDVRQPVISPKTYLAGEKSNKQVTGITPTESTLMFDFFGALDY